MLNKQGHTNASGISVSVDNIPKLIEYYNTQELPLPKAFALYTYQHKDIANNDYHLFKSLCAQYDESFNKYPNIYGKGLDEPNICIKDVPITNIEVLKNNHTVKATIAPNITLMWLWLTNDKVKELKEQSEQDTEQDILLDILGIPNINIFNRKKTYQFIVKDYVIKNSNPFE